MHNCFQCVFIYWHLEKTNFNIIILICYFKIGNVYLICLGIMLSFFFLFLGCVNVFISYSMWMCVSLWGGVAEWSELIVYSLHLMQGCGFKPLLCCVSELKVFFPLHFPFKTKTITNKNNPLRHRVCHNLMVCF